MSEEDGISERILEIVETYSPKTVEELIEQAQREIKVPRDAVLDRVIELQNEGKLILNPPPETVPTNLSEYLLSASALWFWVTTVLSASTVASIFTIGENAYPYVYIRYVLSSIFVLFLPGYCMMKALLPLKEMGNVERTALSMGISLALVPIVGLILDYTPWGIRLTPMAVSLLALTIVLSIAGLAREHQQKTRGSN